MKNEDLYTAAPFDLTQMTAPKSSAKSPFTAVYSAGLGPLNELRPLVLPKPGDYIRITNELDVYYGHLAEVLDVENLGRPGRKTIHLMMSPFDGGVKDHRPIDPGCFEILTEMEVIAVVSR